MQKLLVSSIFLYATIFPIAGTAMLSAATPELFSITAPVAQSWELILINAANPVPADYLLEFVTLSNGNKVDKRIYPSLQLMFDTARAEGIFPRVNSGYRSHSEQQELYDERINMYLSQGSTLEQARDLTSGWVAFPGTSEHEIAIAVDIGGDWVNSTSDEVYVWFANNAHKFGFILRYPEGKSHITGINYEPWHYRYVGDVATEIYEAGITLEEYLLR
ncbi:M15 family metallopeptidase [Candidatus Epulonipiscium viviparus]|uniref:M15 family metallopeptidase n=1 Tax=Candidatus Epulonipiscium viviparus TaxID=420336 RepID=UPI000496D52E|nr:M15 family metallopeptidase [Candidatus Epulopiscium viviparus]